MKVNITLDDEFKRKARLLAKKYHSLPDDLIEFQKSLMKNPLQGDSLGHGVRKAIAVVGEAIPADAPTRSLSKLCVRQH